MVDMAKSERIVITSFAEVLGNSNPVTGVFVKNIIPNKRTVAGPLSKTIGLQLPFFLPSSSSDNLHKLAYAFTQIRSDKGSFVSEVYNAFSRDVRLNGGSPPVSIEQAYYSINNILSPASQKSDDYVYPELAAKRFDRQLQRQISLMRLYEEMLNERISEAQKANVSNLESQLRILETNLKSLKADQKKLHAKLLQAENSIAVSEFNKRKQEVEQRKEELNNIERELQECQQKINTIEQEIRNLSINIQQAQRLPVSDHMSTYLFENVFLQKRKASALSKLRSVLRLIESGKLDNEKYLRTVARRSGIDPKAEEFNNNVSALRTAVEEALREKARVERTRALANNILLHSNLLMISKILENRLLQNTIYKSYVDAKQNAEGAQVEFNSAKEHLEAARNSFNQAKNSYAVARAGVSGKRGFELRSARTERKRAKVYYENAKAELLAARRNYSEARSNFLVARKALREAKSLAFARVTDANGKKVCRIPELNIRAKINSALKRAERFQSNFLTDSNIAALGEVMQPDLEAAISDARNCLEDLKKQDHAVHIPIEKLLAVPSSITYIAYASVMAALFQLGIENKLIDADFAFLYRHDYLLRSSQPTLEPAKVVVVKQNEDDYLIDVITINGNKNGVESTFYDNFVLSKELAANDNIFRITLKALGMPLPERLCQDRGQEVQRRRFSSISQQMQRVFIGAVAMFLGSLLVMNGTSKKSSQEEVLQKQHVSVAQSFETSNLKIVDNLFPDVAQKMFLAMLQADAKVLEKQPTTISAYVDDKMRAGQISEKYAKLIKDVLGQNTPIDRYSLPGILSTLRNVQGLFSSFDLTAAQEQTKMALMRGLKRTANNSNNSLQLKRAKNIS